MQDKLEFTQKQLDAMDEMANLDLWNKSIKGHVPDAAALKRMYKDFGEEEFIEICQEDLSAVTDGFEKLPPWKKEKVVEFQKLAEKFYTELLNQLNGNIPVHVVEKTKSKKRPKKKRVINLFRSYLPNTIFQHGALSSVKPIESHVWQYLIATVWRGKAQMGINRYLYENFYLAGQLACSQPIRTIAKQTGLSKSTVLKAIQGLVDKKIIHQSFVPEEVINNRGRKKQAVYTLGFITADDKEVWLWEKNYQKEVAINENI